MEIKIGKYRHYKGKEYKVLGVGKHTETHEDLVIYEPLYESDFAKISARPLSMFLENVTIDGKEVPRFEYIGNESI